MRVSPLRRAFGAGLVLFSGLLLLWAVVTDPPGGVLAQLLLWALAALLLLGAVRLYQDTRAAVRLVGDRLEDSDGELIVMLEEIESVERGLLALRASNGFSLKLRSEHPPRWKMGLWWRLGRRASFGGVAAPGEAKALAGAIELALAARKEEAADQR